MSFALVNKNNSKETDRKMSTSAKFYDHHNLDYHDSVIHLNSTIGNQAVQNIIRYNTGFDFAKIGIQPKLKISQPGDAYEQEADRIAEKVMRMSTSDHISPTVSTYEKPVNRKCQACQDDEENEKKNMNIGRMSVCNNRLEITENVEQHVNNALHSGGLPIDSATRVFMEPRFGRDFSRVRIHSGPTATKSAQALNAHAYTVGHDIVFGW